MQSLTSLYANLPDGAIIITSAGVLREAFGAAKPTEPKKPNLIPTEIAKKMLKEKGYLVESAPAFNNLMKAYGIEPQGGRKNRKYSYEAIENIPAKK